MEDNELKKVGQDLVVTMDYRLEVDGQEIDAGPIEFIQGHGNIIPGLENEIEGMEVGEEKEVFIKAVDGYGEYDSELEIDVSLNSFPEDFEIQLGRPMRLQDGEGHIFTGVAIALTDETVKLNLNHPLAGKDLLFNTKIVDLRQATPVELERGYLASSCSGCSDSDCSDCG